MESIHTILNCGQICYYNIYQLRRATLGLPKWRTSFDSGTVGGSIYSSLHLCSCNLILVLLAAHEPPTQYEDWQAPHNYTCVIHVLHSDRHVIREAKEDDGKQEPGHSYPIDEPAPLSLKNVP